MVDAHSIVPKPSPTIRGRLLRSGQEDGGLADQGWHRRRRRACDAQSVSSDVAALAQVVADKLNLRASNTCKPRRGFEAPCLHQATSLQYETNNTKAWRYGGPTIERPSDCLILEGSDGYVCCRTFSRVFQGPPGAGRHMEPPEQGELSGSMWADMPGRSPQEATKGPTQISHLA
ncbi:unnamed protein product [Gadus morhua 'NCC']